MTKTTQFFAAHDDAYIYGVGRTEAEAIAEWRTGVGSDQLASVSVTEMTPALFAQVSDHGGALNWDECDGVLCTAA
tara:strand:- start:269 stop:496 length:228 start_codon:yes stop_codon:yes gene_type:complete